MIVSCELEHSALLLKCLEALDDDPEYIDIFLTFGHSFTSAEQYVRDITQTISGRLAGVNQELAKRGESTFPPLPAELVNESYNPASRLLGLMRYVENLITDERRVIWIFYPLEISDPSAYFQLIGYLNGAARAGFKKTGRKSEFGALAGPLSRAWRYTTSRRLQSCAFGIEIIGDNQTAMEKSRESPIFPPPHSDP